MSHKVDDPPAYPGAAPPLAPQQAYYGAGQSSQYPDPGQQGYYQGYPPQQGGYNSQQQMYPGPYPGQPGPYPQQGGYYQQQGPYPPQGGYYQDDRGRKPGFAEVLLASLACCCCLDCLLF